jgi:hypothetical protein
MFTMYFGNYLLQEKKISTEILKDILSQVDHTHAKLGVLAIEAGYMNSYDVENVHTAQMQIDKRFGALATELGFLSEAQVNELLTKQNKPYSAFNQLLIDKGIMDYRKLSVVLEQYRLSCGLSEEIFEMFKDDDEQTVVDYLVGYDESNQIVSNYFSVFIKNIQRFISNNAVFRKVQVLEALETKYVASQALVAVSKQAGPNRWFTGFSSDKAGMLHFASVFGNMEINIMDEMAEDILGEFLNCNNGIFTANLSEQDIVYNLEPQIFSISHKFEMKQIYCIPFELENYKYNLIIGFNK